MSNMEYWEGTLIEISVPKEKIDWCDQVIWLQNQGFIFDELDLEDMYYYEQTSNCLNINNKWYKVDKYPYDPEADLCVIEKQGKIIKFKTSFYNGCGGLSEVLEEGLDKLLQEKVKSNNSCHNCGRNIEGVNDEGWTSNACVYKSNCVKSIYYGMGNYHIPIEVNNK